MNSTESEDLEFAGQAEVLADGLTVEQDFLRRFYLECIFLLFEQTLVFFGIAVTLECYK
ncbi:hypothetical protein [Haloactinomyces albus]|uniref:Uncharacterized protein n=1 Tax=Haloactinomyces albus TaxID=1352928 RepID=A0AAE4CMD8_9ACTN|nr:hypothetical protein [Haloactinomyces albus]MDR7300867.1 hypothetical protein [Haloactinomyces albus]